VDSFDYDALLMDSSSNTDEGGCLIFYTVYLWPHGKICSTKRVQISQRTAVTFP
jgi:hypothetical protein